MNKTTGIIATIGAISFFGAASAEGIAPDFGQDTNAALCYQETIKAQNGVAREALSTRYCQRALRDKPQSSEDRSANYYNRGLIELAQGKPVAARASFGRAVRLSRKVDMRNVALAQIAHKLGEYELAIEQYNLLVNSGFTAPSTPELQSIVLRNRDRALRAFAGAHVASEG